MAILITVIGFLLFFIQIGLWPGLFPNTFAPELQIPLIVSLALLVGKKEGLIYATVSGLLIDLYFMHGLGIRLLLYLTIAYLLGTYREKFSKKSSFANAFMTLFCGMAFQILYALFLIFTGGKISIFTYFKMLFSHELIVQLVLSYVFYFIFIRFTRKKKHYF